MAIDFLKKVKTSIVVNTHHINIYVPAQFFDSGMANWLGDKCMTTGMFFIETFGSETAKGKLFKLNIPVALILNFSSKTDVTRQIATSVPEAKYYRLGLEKGDVLIENLNHVQDIESTISFMSFFNSGKVDKSTPYIELHDIFKESARLNSVNLGVPSAMVEVMISEMMRDVKDGDVPYRQIYGTAKDKGYEPFSVKDVAKTSSVFSALAFEDINASMQIAVKKTIEGKKQFESPIEKAIHY